MARRAHLITKYANGQKASPKRSARRGGDSEPGGPRDVKRIALTSRRQDGTQLKKPPTPCLPWEQYITRFPAAEMEKRNHRIKWVGNQKLVVMPPDPNVPWTLDSYQKETAELDEVVTSGEEDSPGVSSMTALRAATGFPHDWQRVSLPPLSSLAESSTARPLVAQCHSRYHGWRRIARWCFRWAGSPTPLAARTVVTAGTEGWYRRRARHDRGATLFRGGELEGSVFGLSLGIGWWSCFWRGHDVLGALVVRWPTEASCQEEGGAGEIEVREETTGGKPPNSPLGHWHLL